MAEQTVQAADDIEVDGAKAVAARAGGGMPHTSALIYRLVARIEADRERRQAAEAREAALRAALSEARRFVQEHRDGLLESCCLLDEALQPIRETLDDGDRAAIEEVEAVLARVDAALSGQAPAADLHALLAAWWLDDADPSDDAFAAMVRAGLITPIVYDLTDAGKASVSESVRARRAALSAPPATEGRDA